MKNTSIMTPLVTTTTTTSSNSNKNGDNYHKEVSKLKKQRNAVLFVLILIVLSYLQLITNTSSTSKSNNTNKESATVGGMMPTGTTVIKEETSSTTHTVVKKTASTISSTTTTGTTTAPAQAAADTVVVVGNLPTKKGRLVVVEKEKIQEKEDEEEEEEEEEEEKEELEKEEEPETITEYDDNINSNNILASKILINEDYSSLSDKKQDIQFEPGSITGLSKPEILKYCYTNPKIYKNHFRTDYFMASVSDEHQLLYRFLPKSASSTSRTMLKTRFNSWEKMLTIQKITTPPLLNYTAFTFIREPLGRFFSGYDEAYVRESPWNAKRQKGSKQITPMYLYENIKNMGELTDVWCPPSSRVSNQSRAECYDGRPTAENGTLASRLERYVSTEDLLKPFNVHLQLQVPLLSNPKTGLRVRVDEIYDKTTEDWIYLSERYGINLNIPNANNVTGVYHGRSATRKADLNKISNTTKQQICEFALIDYCCLNIPLPSPCENLYCRLNSKEDIDGSISTNKKQRLQIQPWSFPNKELSS